MFDCVLAVNGDNAWCVGLSTKEVKLSERIESIELLRLSSHHDRVTFFESLPPVLFSFVFVFSFC